MQVNTPNTECFFGYLSRPAHFCPTESSWRKTTHSAKVQGNGNKNAGHIPSTFPTWQGHHEHSNVLSSLGETLDVGGGCGWQDFFLGMGRYGEVPFGMLMAKQLKMMVCLQNGHQFQQINMTNNCFPVCFGALKFEPFHHFLGPQASKHQTGSEDFGPQGHIPKTPPLEVSWKTRVG